MLAKNFSAVRCVWEREWSWALNLWLAMQREPFPCGSFFFVFFFAWCAPHSLVLGWASKLTKITTKNARSSSHRAARNVSIKLTPRCKTDHVSLILRCTKRAVVVRQMAPGRPTGVGQTDPTSSCPRWLCICAKIPQSTSQANGGGYYMTYSANVKHAPPPYCSLWTIRTHSPHTHRPDAEPQEIDCVYTPHAGSFHYLEHAHSPWMDGGKKKSLNRSAIVPHLGQRVVLVLQNSKFNCWYSYLKVIIIIALWGVQ